MKVLLVVTKGDLGGAQKRVLNLAQRFKKKEGVDVTVGVGSFGDWLPAQLRQEGIAFKRFNNLSRSNPLRIITWWFEFWQYLNKSDFDVVHLNSSSALSGTLPARLSSGRPKTVFTFRGLSIISPHYPAIPPLKWFYWLAFWVFSFFVDTGVFQCKHDKKIAKSRRLAPAKSVVIRPGIDPQAIGYLKRDKACGKLENKLGVDLEDRQVIGTIGRLSPQKNYGFLLEAFAKVGKKHQNAILVIIGDGTLKEDLQKKAQDLGINEPVYFAGSIPGAARLLKSFDIFVLPSLYEGVSMTLTEAVHADLPILASRVGGNPETVCGNEKALFSKGSKEEFEDKLSSLLEDKQARDAARAGDDCAETLLLSKSVESYLDLYKRII